MSSLSLNSCASDAASTCSSGRHSFSALQEGGGWNFDKCPKCFVYFDFIKRNQSTSKVPLILTCSHTVCEECIKKLHQSGYVACPVCKEQSFVPRSHINQLTEVFTPHFALIGHLAWSRSLYGPTHRKQVHLESTGRTLKNIHQSPASETPGDEIADYISDAEAMTTLAFDKCTEHNNSPININCESCDVPVCCYCFVEKHPGHFPNYLYKLNDSEIAEIPRLKYAAMQILQQLKLTEKRLQQIKTLDHSKVEADIKNYFNTLHGKLHLVERKLKEKVRGIKVTDVDLENISVSVRASAERLSQFLKSLELSTTDQINKRTLFELTENLRDTPCCLVSEGGNLEQIRLTTPEDLENLEDMFDVEISNSLDYTLVPLETFSEPPPQSPKKPGPSHEPVQEVVEVPRNEATPLRGKPTSARDRQKTKRHDSQKDRKGQLRKVNVTHLNDINSFYVQDVSSHGLLRDINRKIYGLKRGLSTEEVGIGKMYGAHYAYKNYSDWRRGIVRQKVESVAKTLYSVFFVDYGNTQQMTMDKLKEIDLPLTNREPLAVECKLKVPEGTKLPSNARYQLVHIIGERELFAKTVQIDQGVHEVELLVQDSLGEIVSIMNLLKQPETEASILPALPEITIEPAAVVMPGALKLLENSTLFRLGEPAQVNVSYIRDPSHIYVVLSQNTSILEKMKGDLESHYARMAGSCIPAKGSAVIVNHPNEHQGDWHRGRIVAINNGTSTASVFFVDWGVTFEVPWANIKMIEERFITIECQAICVEMSDIHPMDPEGWTPEATDELNKVLEKQRNCKMTISSTDPLRAVFFLSKYSNDYCLNTLLVEKGLAISTGNLSQVLNWPQTHAPDESETSDCANFYYQIIKRTEQRILEDEDESEGGDAEAIVRAPVSVVRCENPDLIYVKFSANADKERDLYRDLQVHYSSTKDTKKSWKAMEPCVIYDSSQKQFVRGKVKGHANADRYFVYLFDQARDALVHKRWIYLYNDYFKQYLGMVYKCRLIRVKPAGDSGQWSHGSKEVLETIFESRKSLYLKKMGRDENMCMMVDMWYSLVIPGNALEPAKQRFVSVAEVLVECGVAIRQNWAAVAASALSASVAASPVDSGSESVKIKKEVEVVEEGKAEEEEQEKVVVAAAAEKPKKRHNNRSSTSWYEMTLEDEKMSKIKNWLPALNYTKETFDGTVTYIDDEAVLSVRDADMNELYVNIEERMKETFDANPPTCNRNVAWSPTQMCTVRYGGLWYRAAILGVNENDSDKMSIVMIDFGSDHTVKRKDVFKECMYLDIPPLVGKLRLYDVVPKNGQWLLEDIDNVQENFLPTDIKVAIKEGFDTDAPFAEIYDGEGFSVNSAIVAACENLVRLKKVNAQAAHQLSTHKEEEMEEEKEHSSYEQDDEELAGYDSDDDVATEFLYADLPAEGRSQVKVEHVLAADEVVVNTEINDDNYDQLLARLHGDITMSADSQPPLNVTKINEPCIALHRSSGQWRRAIVRNTQSIDVDFVLVMYVDFGFLDMLRTKSIKQMHPHWLRLPAATRIAKLNVGVEESADRGGEQHSGLQIMHKMEELLVGKTLQLEVITEDPLVVHLYDGDELRYQELIDDGSLTAQL